MAELVTAGLWIGAIGCGVMAGVYFAFSAFVMQALAAIPEAQGAAAMRSINRVILSSLFMPLFFGTSLVAFGLAGWAIAHWADPRAPWSFAAGAIYVAGMFLCTVLFNVPLNNRLDEQTPPEPGVASLWPDYVRRWTRWNHLRTVASTLACGLFTMAIRASG